ncbi:MAG: GHKL domain-containing protein [Gammaproteobacteria bacterium]|jgi:two-component system sensor histidine kinase PhoQ|nr:GHKL domain-containing protein [Zhongshania sp.]MBU0538581.1 GHKL domain-containing protein [Gammaproteobacteria bacterium]MBU1833725.1 GHKL domain-containing protein [Gammaproteobacteria bacterium]
MPAHRSKSITRRLTIASLSLMALLLAATGIAIDRAHTASLISAEQDQLRLQFFGLLGAIEWQDGTVDMGDRLKDPRFWQFRSGLYAQIRLRNGTPLWQSVSSETIPLPAPANTPRSGQELFSEIRVDKEPFYVFQYHAIWETEDDRDIPLLFSLYSSQTSLLNERKKFQHQLSLWLGLVLTISLIVTALILYWGLRPLRELATDLKLLERGDTSKLRPDYPRELQGITHNLNQLLDKEKKQRERYRNTLADLAHSLKTPLAILKGGDSKDAVVTEQISRMDNIINYQLKRAVSTGKQNLNGRIQLQPLIERLCNTLKKVYRDKSLHFEISLDLTQTVGIDEQDAMELFGNLLDNASKACRKKIIISSENANNHTAIYIDDDGPGISEESREKLLQRGIRGDQYGQGQGLGLAIVGDIVDSYGGAIRFTDSKLGGVCVEVTLVQQTGH